LVGVDHLFNKRVSEDETPKAIEMGHFFGRQFSYNGASKVVPPQSSSSQMIFGKRPPEARGKRNKILSAGGSSNTFYQSSILNNMNRTGAAPQDSVSAVSINL